VKQVDDKNPWLYNENQLLYVEIEFWGTLVIDGLISRQVEVHRHLDHISDGG